MGKSFNDFNSGHVSDSALRGLAFELKNPLINIARQAELGDKKAFKNMQQTAEQALMLIDSFLLNAQTEYGQIPLALEPTTLGSVFFDASHRLREPANLAQTDVIIDDRTTEPIMTHKLALTSVLLFFGSSLLDGQTSKRRQIIMRGFKTKSGKLGVGVFSDKKITKEDLEKSLALQGRAHMPLAKVSGQSHVSLSIAAGLCKAIGGTMGVKQLGKLSGLATELPKSDQLALV